MLSIKSLHKGHADFRVLFGFWGGFGTNVLFALYHCLFGGALSSVWHVGIGIYYLLLAAVRGAILLTEHKIKYNPPAKKRLWRQRVFFATSVLLLLLNLSLALPVSLMVLLKKPVIMSNITAIAMAAYTTYKIAAAIVHMRTNRACPPLLQTLQTIYLIDALVSVLAVQNTLIVVNTAPGQTGAMLGWSAAAGAAIYLAIVAVTICRLVKTRC